MRGGAWSTAEALAEEDGRAAAARASRLAAAAAEARALLGTSLAGPAAAGAAGALARHARDPAAAPLLRAKPDAHA